MFEESAFEHICVSDTEQQRVGFFIDFAGDQEIKGDVSVSENGHFVQFRIVDMFERRAIEASPYRRKIMAAFSEETFFRRLAKIGYDPDDGEIDYCIDLPVEDCPLTRKQFEYCLQLLLLLARLVHHRIATILEKGRDPGFLDVDDLDAL